ncbi:MAG: Protein of unknown function (DUF1631) [Marinobacter excellens HL-55]|uniref:DUF1631 family protein n=1 Tax=Marinobacter excellens HL-55 TaxID=1305731 RepID=A0A0P7YJ42_9GAMM|nr:MAG: Protein of unknown function (DUF1631) [Marinobacter excellens HL-55]
MSPTPSKPQAVATSRKVVSERINQVLSGIRVPDLPYPVGKPAPESVPDWRPLLFSCWTEQRDERVTQVLRSVDIEWSVRQVNAAYLSDRIMDVFLKTSGLHTTLIGRVARLRFWLAWQLDANGAGAFSSGLLDWLDNLQEWRGWSDTGGRSARMLLDQLDSLVIAVSGSFESGTVEPLETYCEQWLVDRHKRETQASKLRERLLETEQGASRQRFADQVARALIGRALTGRNLPTAVSRFIVNDWYKVLKQSTWSEGFDSELYRHANKLLEWLVWLGDPALSDRDRNRLYHVGEQIGDRIQDVWSRALGQDLPQIALDEIQSVIVARIRGEVPELKPALSGEGNFTWESQWLAVMPVPADDAAHHSGLWFVEGEGAREQRRFFFALLDDSSEVLWTNGAGVKLGLQTWPSFLADIQSGALRPLPSPTPFGDVLSEAVELLSKVCVKQQKQREHAAQEARARAEVLRKEKEEAERLRVEQEAARQAEIERQQAEVEQKRLDDEKAEQVRLHRELEVAATKQVEGIGLGGWIVMAPPKDGEEPVRLKLAVKISASRKFVFVDRLGLNRKELLHDELVSGIVAGNIRVLGSAAEFDDTLSRVVGRIRVGRN